VPREGAFLEHVMVPGQPSGQERTRRCDRIRCTVAGQHRRQRCWCKLGRDHLAAGNAGENDQSVRNVSQHFPTSKVETIMKIAIVGAALWVAIAPAAIAQGGGYPASPSHGITGTNPDGTPRYGSEPSKEANPTPSAVGRNGATTPVGRGGAPGPEHGTKDGDRKPERAGNAAGR
jgi:hypothetical protein